MKIKNLLKLTNLFLIVCSFFAQQPNYVNAQDCGCKEYLYLNDPDTDEIHKFEVDPATGVLTEIGTPWSSGISPPVNNPHGLGTDLNGNIFIGELNSDLRGPDGATDTSPQGNIYKIACDGTLIDEFYQPANFAGAFNFGSNKGFIYLPDNQNETIRIYDPNCSGDLVGEMQIAGNTDVLIWGLYVDEDVWYANDVVSGNIYTGVSDPSLYTLPASNSGTLFASTGFTPAGSPFSAPGIVGVTRDATGNVYVIVNRIADGNPSNSPMILKYDASGTLINSISNTNQSSNVNATNGLPGWSSPRGLIYSSTTNLLYLSTAENCIVVFDTNLVEQSALNFGNPAGTQPKGLSVAVECCPQPAEQETTVNSCDFLPDEKVFLNQLLTCEGTICEGTDWIPADAASTAVYEACSQSITVTPGCYSYSKVSDGISQNSQCGAFNLIFNVCFESLPQPPAISVTDNTCNPDVAGSINLDTPCEDSTLEWSTDAGATWSATAPTYETTPVTVRARCIKDCGNAVTADVTTAPQACCPPQTCIRQAGEFTITKRRP